MRVLCLTFGDATTASTFYRIHQYEAPLTDRGIHLKIIPTRQFQDWNSVQSYDAVLVQKSLLPTDKVRQLRRAARRLLYDVDDAIWHPHGKPHFLFTRVRQAVRLRAITKAADQCLVANGVLAAHLQRFTSRVAVLPMALDDALWKPHNSSPARQSLRVGWSGHPINLNYLENIEPALLQIQRDFPKAEFVVFSGQAPRFRQLKSVHLPFVPGQEPEVIRSFDIGLLPLPDDMFSAGKSPIKGLQYLACGASTVVSPAGGVKEMFHDGVTGLFAGNIEEWSKQLRLVIEQPQIRAAMGASARQSFEDKFALCKMVPQFVGLLRGQAPNRHG